MATDVKNGGYAPTEFQKVETESPEQAVITALKQNSEAALRYVLGLERAPELTAFKEKSQGTVAVGQDIFERDVKKYMAEWVGARMRFDVDLAEQYLGLLEREDRNGLEKASRLLDIDALEVEAQFTIEKARALVQIVEKHEKEKHFIALLSASRDPAVPQIFAYLNSRGRLPFKNKEKQKAALQMFAARLPN